MACTLPQLMSQRSGSKLSSLSIRPCALIVCGEEVRIRNALCNNAEAVEELMSLLLQPLCLQSKKLLNTLECFLHVGYKTTTQLFDLNLTNKNICVFSIKSFFCCHHACISATSRVSVKAQLRHQSATPCFGFWFFKTIVNNNTFIFCKKKLLNYVMMI